MIMEDYHKASLIYMMYSLILMKLCRDNDYDTLKPKYIGGLRPNFGFEEDSFNALNEIIDYLEVNF